MPGAGAVKNDRLRQPWLKYLLSASVAEPPLFEAAPAPAVQGPGADSDSFGSAPAPSPDKNGRLRLRLHIQKFVILSSEKVQ